MSLERREVLARSYHKSHAIKCAWRERERKSHTRSAREIFRILAWSRTFENEIVTGMLKNYSNAMLLSKYCWSVGVFFFYLASCIEFQRLYKAKFFFSLFLFYRAILTLGKILYRIKDEFIESIGCIFLFNKTLHSF